MTTINEEAVREFAREACDSHFEASCDHGVPAALAEYEREAVAGGRAGIIEAAGLDADADDVADDFDDACDRAVALACDEAAERWSARLAAWSDAASKIEVEAAADFVSALTALDATGMAETLADVPHLVRESGLRAIRAAVEARFDTDDRGDRAAGVVGEFVVRAESDTPPRGGDGVYVHYVVIESDAEQVAFRVETPAEFAPWRLGNVGALADAVATLADETADETADQDDDSRE